MCTVSDNVIRNTVVLIKSDWRCYYFVIMCGFVDLLITTPQLKRTALHLAKEVGTVRILVAAGADLDAKDAVRKSN